ncbi:unnamed protein product [Blepharisma stoltei]|uniref:Nucleoside diphosphate kinase n=1 Tax=Blepharisma stoltei TaxID=1481888 RepID=A0AAU9KBD5_9CILI|nr:unnamed protein product [Blepharisma stoltei]
MIKPDCYTHIGRVIDSIIQAGLTINSMKMIRFTLNDAVQFYSEHQGKPFFDDLVNFISSDVVVGMELIAENAVAIWRELIGPTNPNTARIDAPRSLRAVFGTEGTHNAVHGSDSPSSAITEISFFFGLKGNPAVLSDCACCIIKPHAINNAGKIIDIILSEGFEISALQMFKLDKQTTEEFLEVYKDVLPEYGSLVDEFISGPCIAMEIRQENVVESFRELCGPADPEVAKRLRPKSIRSQFGINKVQNAVHCTDIPEDGILECEYFFKIISRST